MAHSPTKTKGGFNYHQWLWLVLVVTIVGGWFYPWMGFAVAFCFLGAVVSGAFVGRKWCGKLCPRGSFNDHLLSRLVPKRHMPDWAKHPATRIGVLVVMMSVLAIRVPAAWGDWNAVGRVFWTLLVVTTAVGIAVGLFTHQRVWCQVCPAGTMASWLGKRRRPRLKLDESSCKNCNVCAKACPMALTPVEVARGGEGAADCLKCSGCVAKCPVDALTFKESCALKSEVDQEATVA